MTLKLKPKQQRIIDQAVQSGAYRDRDEVLEQALAIIGEQLQMEDWMTERRAEIASHIATGFAQAQRGELIDSDAALDMLRQRRRERLKTER